MSPNLLDSSPEDLEIDAPLPYLAPPEEQRIARGEAQSATRGYTTSYTDNMLEQRRRTLLSALNSRWIYGRVPLLHTIIFLLEMAAVSILMQKFNASYAQRPILTTMVTNAVLGGIADTTAQIITSVQQRSQQRAANKRLDKDRFISIEFGELGHDRKGSWPAGEILPPTRNQPPPFDFERLTRFMSYGFLMTPVQYKWFGFLHNTFPIAKGAATVNALKRVAFDQLIFAPIGLGLFFTFMTLAEGGGKRAITRKFQDVYIPALKANYILWPAVQIVNFRVIPLHLQIPFVSTIGIAWTAYLSLSNASEDEKL